VEAGAAGLLYIRVKEAGEIDAAKPVLEGLNPQERSKLISLCQAEEVSTHSWLNYLRMSTAIKSLNIKPISWRSMRVRNESKLPA
jgi:hypothetical protein